MTTSTSAHIARDFDKDLAALRSAVLDMGALAGEMLGSASGLIAGPDSAVAERVVETDRRLDAMREALDERAVLLIARRQPVAVDLRATVAVLRISGALERIGDHAKNVAKRSNQLPGAGAPPEATAAVRRMGERARALLEASLAAYGSMDTVRAEQVWRADADLDAMLSSLFRELLTHMAENPRAIGACTHLMFCGKNMERIGDHATTIAEAVSYIATGSAFEGDRPKLASADIEADD